MDWTGPISTSLKKTIPLYYLDSKKKQQISPSTLLLLDGNAPKEEWLAAARKFTKSKEVKIIYIFVDLDHEKPFDSKVREWNDDLYQLFKHTPRIVVGYASVSNPTVEYERAMDKCFDICAMEYVEVLNPVYESFLGFYDPGMDKKSRTAGLTNYYQEQIRQKHKTITKRKPRVYERLDKQVVEHALGCLSVAMIRWSDLDNMSNMLLGDANTTSDARKESTYEKQTCTQFVNAASFKLKNLDNKLQFVICGNNLVDYTPDTMPSTFWKRLKMYACSCNQLSELLLSGKDKETGEDILMPNLLELYASHNSIRQIDPAIQQFTKLRLLDLAANNLEEIPSEFFALTNLRVLDLGMNKLVTIPSDIVRLKKLKKLYLDHNRLEILPFNLFLLEKLEILHLNNNRLRTLPSTLASMEKLQVLLLDNNPNLKDIPKFVLLGDIHVLKSYMQENSLRGEETYRSKLLIVGQENVGKTSLLISLLRATRGADSVVTLKKTASTIGIKKTEESSFESVLLSGKPVSTDGIDIKNLFFETNVATDGKKDMKGLQFSAWDFAGQEVYYSTHSFFLTDRSMYIVVFNLLKGSEACNVEYWLNSVKSRAPKSSIFLVGTHLDSEKLKRSKAINEMEELFKKYRKTFNVVGSVAVSCETDDNIAYFIDKLLNVAKKEPYMGAKIPSSYFLLEDLCAMERRNKIIQGLAPVITYEEIYEVALKSNLFSTTDVKYFEDQLDLSLDVLHLLGSITRFKEIDPELEKLIILDPQWITKVFATIITTKPTFIKDGIVDMNTLFEHIWKQFPSKLHDMLLTLLQKFEIVFPLPDDADLERGSKSVSKLFNEVKSPSRDLNVPKSSLQELREPLKSPSRDNLNESTYYRQRLLIPSLLPDLKPEFRLIWPTKDPKKTEYGRIYALSFLPNGLFSRFMIRLLKFSYAIRYWKYGILTRTKKSDVMALIEVDPTLNRIAIQARGDYPAEFFRKIIELLDSLLLNWFKVPARISTICPQCVRNDVKEPTYFSKEECLESSSKGTWFLLCKAELNNDHVVNMAQVAPDIAMADFEGKRIDLEKEVILMEEIGRGAFGTVFKGIYNKEIVAVKQLNIPSMEDQKFKAIYNEFRKEVWIMSGLNHPCIVNLKGFSLAPTLAMVMEIVNHGDLYSYMNDKSNDISWALRLRIAWDIAKGLAFLHSTDPPLLHRDIKSPNILLSSVNPMDLVVAKIADFGTTDLVFSEKFAAQSSKERDIANPVWLAPEVMREESYATAADVYPFGIILWELYVREHPFDEFQFEFMSDMEKAIRSGTKPTIPEDCPEDYANLIRVCIESDPLLRPSFKTIVEELLPPVIAKWAPEIQPAMERIENIEDNYFALRASKDGLEDDFPWIEGTHLATVETFKDVTVDMVLANNHIWCLTDTGVLVHYDSDTGKPLGRFENVTKEKGVGLFYDVNHNRLILCEPTKVITIDPNSISYISEMWDPFEGSIYDHESLKKKKKKLRFCKLDESMLTVYKSREDMSKPDIELPLALCKFEILDTYCFLTFQGQEYCFSDAEDSNFKSRLKFFMNAIQIGECKLPRIEFITMNNSNTKILDFYVAPDHYILLTSDMNLKIYKSTQFSMNSFNSVALDEHIHDILTRISKDEYPSVAFEMVDDALWVILNEQVFIIDLDQAKMIDRFSTPSPITELLHINHSEAWLSGEDKCVRIYNKDRKYLSSFKLNYKVKKMLYIGSHVLLLHSNGLDMCKISDKCIEKEFERRHEDPILALVLVEDEKSTLWTMSNVSMNIWN